MSSASDEKWLRLNCFSVQGTDGISRGPVPQNWVGDQDNRIPNMTLSSGLEVPGRSGHFRA